MKNKKSLIIISAIFLCMVIAVLVGAAIIKREKNYKYTEVVSRRDREDHAGSKYIKYNDGVIRCGNDGITALSKDGEMKYAGAFTMSNPSCVAAGHYVAVADIGGTEVVVFDEKGSEKSVSMLSPIAKVSVSEQGELAVLMSSDDAYEIQVLDPYAESKDSMLKGVIYTYIKDDGYALDVAISKDGAKVVTSYVKVTAAGVNSSLTFYNFSGVGKGENADRIVGVFPYKDMIFTNLSFLDNNTVLAVSDKETCVFKMSQKPELLTEKEQKEEIIALATADGAYAMLVKDEESGSGVRLDAFSASGKELFKKKLPFQASFVEIGLNDVWAASEKDMAIISKSGRVKYSGECDQNIQFMSEGSRGDLFLIVSGGFIEEIKLKERSE